MKSPNDNGFTQFTNLAMSGDLGAQFTGKATVPTDTDLGAGRLFYDSTLGTFRFYNGTSWVTLTGGGGSAVQALAAAGAVNTTTQTTTIASAGAIALTLADGTVGQTKTITMIADGGDATLTPANFANGTTITFNDVGDSVTLQFVGTEWYLVSNNGATIA